MDSATLLVNLSSLLESAPTSDQETPEEHHRWVAKTKAYIQLWKPSSLFGHHADMWLRGHKREKVLMLADLHEAVETLKLQVGDSEDLEAAGMVLEKESGFTFLKNIMSLFESAGQSLLIVDPYANLELLNWLTRAPDALKVKLLRGRKKETGIREFEEVYSQLKKRLRRLEVRLSDDFHDRVIIVDDEVCWVCGQSFAVAALSKPTYLLPLPTDISKLKIQIYKNLWDASPICSVT